MTVTTSPPRSVSAAQLYGDPLLMVLAVTTTAVLLSVVLRPVDVNRADFYTLYDSARAFTAGHDMYRVPLRPGAGLNLNPPALTLLAWPVVGLSLRAAFLAWTLINVLLFGAIARIVAETLDLAPWRVACWLLLSQATFAALQLGGFTAPVALAVTLAWRADRDGRRFRAGWLLGLAIGAKLFLGLFVLDALARRSHRRLAGIGVGAAAFFAAGLLVAGPTNTRSWLVALQHVTWAVHLSNASILGFLTRTLTTPPPALETTPLAIRPDWIRPLWLLASAGIVSVVGWLAGRRRDRTHVDAGWLLVLTGCLLVSPLGWVYYAPLAIGPVAAVAARGPVVSRRLVWIGYALLCVPYTVLLRPFGPWQTATIASVYAFGISAWFVAAMHATNARSYAPSS